MSSDRPPPRRQHRSRRQREVHEDTVVAYHNYLQTLIKERLNAINLGPGKTPCQIAIVLYAWGLACAVVGILVIALRPRHLYLTGVWSRFVGPLFIIIFLLSFGAATYFLVDATRKSNKYRRNLRFQALGQFGVKVVHTTRLPHEKIMREEYKTGSTPHVSAKPPRQHRAYRYGQSNRGYLPDNGRDYGREYGREQPGPRYGQQYSHGPPPGHPGPPGPPDVVPGRPRQFKSRVVIQQQQQPPPHGGRGPPHGPPPAQRGYAPEDDSSV